MVKHPFTYSVAIFFTAAATLFSYHWSKNQLDCANSISCVKNLGQMDGTSTEGTFLNRPVSVPTLDLSGSVLGQGTSDLPNTASTSVQKHIYVDLATQTLYAYEGTNQAFTSLVSTGRWGRTPTGEFRIWIKLRATRMSGGSGSDYYDLPNVPYTMFFYNNNVPRERGFALHGAYWHNNFGHEMSHGCVNLSIVDAEKLYNWAQPTTKGTLTYPTSEDPGTPITICDHLSISNGQTPVCNDATTTVADAATPDTSLRQRSIDGAWETVAQSTVLPEEQIHHRLWVTNTKTDESTLVFDQIMPDRTYLNVPINSWAPDNKYFFVEYRVLNGPQSRTMYLVFKADGSSFSSQPYLNIHDYFANQEIPYRIDETTGWAAPGLLLVRTKQLDSDEPGPSYWFEVYSQRFIQLSTRF